MALREELNRVLNEGEQQAEGASAQIPLPESWETVISTYQKGRCNNYWLTRTFNTQQITRRAELLEEVSPLPEHGVFTGNIGHQVRYICDEDTISLRTPPGSNLMDNAGFLVAPENILSEVLNRPARFDLLEALIAAHSYLFTSYREARNYAESQESPDYVCRPPHRFWAIEDLVLTIHVISRQLMTLPNNLAAETPLSELLNSRQPTSGDLTMHFSGERFRLNSLIGQADLEFNQCLKFVIELLEFYKQRLQGQDASGHASGDASVTKVLADLDLLMLSMRQALE
ncbi:hypothetical protein [Endozoicomonas euniceicola]|uniref:Uncharacterized protein n=1 Tax=Endozoicomonas euniceicola TaxID=1234143 RepID=A0ABY6GQU7_9GAMM|nr:hypothetical protein [Endozoicomonas euniceicola]UYM15126.1 hypothetical protein NX720_20005 [Endozoicomonas euniceicola]